MIIKKAVYKEVLVKQKRVVENEVYGCDLCQKEFTRLKKLEATIYYKKTNKKSINVDFCSWSCFFNYIKKSDFNKVDFISLPFIDEENKDELINLIKQIKL